MSLHEPNIGKILANLAIHNGSKFPPYLRHQIALWFRRQGHFLETQGNKFSKTYKARFRTPLPK